jgi:hypothetical protein
MSVALVLQFYPSDTGKTDKRLVEREGVMPETLEDTLRTLGELLENITNPRVACENRCRRTITLQYVHWDDSGDAAPRWSCDATAECGSGNEHFCRFAPLSADGYGSTPLEAASACLAGVEERVRDRLELEQLEELDEEF